MSVESRFWSKVDKSGPLVREELGPCWLWTGPRLGSAKKYGVFNYENIGVPAHRASWQFHTGNDPGGLFVCHHCDNGMCVRPEHLFLGTHAENMSDMKAKGRSLKGVSRVPPERVRRGEGHGTHKMTEAGVRLARTMYGFGFTTHALARAFGVGQATISRVVSGRLWRHVDTQ